jgi:hypothetical protein
MISLEVRSEMFVDIYPEMWNEGYNGISDENTAHWPALWRDTTRRYRRRRLDIYYNTHAVGTHVILPTDDYFSGDFYECFYSGLAYEGGALAHSGTQHSNRNNQGNRGNQGGNHGSFRGASGNTLTHANTNSLSGKLVADGKSELDVQDRRYTAHYSEENELYQKCLRKESRAEKLKEIERGRNMLGKRLSSGGGSSRSTGSNTVTDITDPNHPESISHENGKANPNSEIQPLLKDFFRLKLSWGGSVSAKPDFRLGVQKLLVRQAFGLEIKEQLAGFAEKYMEDSIPISTDLQLLEDAGVAFNKTVVNDVPVLVMKNIRIGEENSVVIRARNGDGPECDEDSASSSTNKSNKQTRSGSNNHAKRRPQKNQSSSSSSSSSSSTTPGTCPWVNDAISSAWAEQKELLHRLGAGGFFHTVRNRMLKASKLDIELAMPSGEQLEDMLTQAGNAKLPVFPEDPVNPKLEIIRQQPKFSLWGDVDFDVNMLANPFSDFGGSYVDIVIDNVFKAIGVTNRFYATLGVGRAGVQTHAR